MLCPYFLKHVLLKRHFLCNHYLTKYSTPVLAGKFFSVAIDGAYRIMNALFHECRKRYADDFIFPARHQHRQ